MSEATPWVELYRLRALLLAYAGWRLEDVKLQLLHRQLTPLLQQLGIPNMGLLADRLGQEIAQGRGPTLEALIPLVTVNETYFFRETQQLEILRTKLLPELAQRNARTRSLRILSAACATGPEAYTIAMLLEDAPVPFLGWQVQIQGVDIDAQVLEQARQALYPAAAFRAMDKAQMARWFRVEGDRYRLVDRVRKVVDFKQGNLLELARWPGFRQFDVILCRNCLIYLDRTAQKRLIELFYSALRPGGYLLLGHSETLMAMGTEFRPHPVHQTLAFMKPLTPLEAPQGLPT